MKTIGKPEPATQNGVIAEVLTAVDMAVAALEQRREKTRSLELAMMQLLTRRARFV